MALDDPTGIMSQLGGATGGVSAGGKASGTTILRGPADKNGSQGGGDGGGNFRNG